MLLQSVGCQSISRGRHNLRLSAGRTGRAARRRRGLWGKPPSNRSCEKNQMQAQNQRTARSTNHAY